MPISLVYPGQTRVFKSYRTSPLVTLESTQTILFFSSEKNIFLRWPLWEPTSQRLNNLKLNSKTVPILPTIDPSLIFSFQILPSPVHLTGYSFCFFRAIFIMFSSNNNFCGITTRLCRTHKILPTLLLRVPETIYYLPTDKLVSYSTKIILSEI